MEISTEMTELNHILPQATTIRFLQSCLSFCQYLHEKPQLLDYVGLKASAAFDATAQALTLAARNFQGNVLSLAEISNLPEERTRDSGGMRKELRPSECFNHMLRLDLQKLWMCHK